MRRKAARVVLFDDQGRVLLLEASDPVDPGKGSWWELPGGGIEAGESSAEAAVRELHEETGIDQVDVGPCVWRQHSRFTFAGINFDQQERIHVAHVRPGGPVPDVTSYRPAGLEALEVMAFKGQRWWEPAELVDLVQSGGRVIPAWLPGQLVAVPAQGWPDEPIDMGTDP